jgi:hypothetical protein
MSLLSRFRARRSLDAARAEALLTGHGIPAGAPADQQALARVLEIAARPGTAQELADEVAAAAAFVQVSTYVKPRRSARRAMAAAACAVAVGGGVAVFATVVPSPHHKMLPLPFGVPAARPTAPASALTRSPSRRPGAAGAIRNPHPSPDRPTWPGTRFALRRAAR